MDLEEFLASVPELSPEVDSWGEARRIYVTAADFAFPIARLTVNEGGRTIYPLIYPIAKGLIQSGAEDLPALFYANTDALPGQREEREVKAIPINEIKAGQFVGFL